MAPHYTIVTSKNTSVLFIHQWFSVAALEKKDLNLNPLLNSLKYFPILFVL